MWTVELLNCWWTSDVFGSLILPPNRTSFIACLDLVWAGLIYRWSANVIYGYNYHVETENGLHVGKHSAQINWVRFGRRPNINYAYKGFVHILAVSTSCFSPTGICPQNWTDYNYQHVVVRYESYSRINVFGIQERSERWISSQIYNSKLYIRQYWLI